MTRQQIRDLYTEQTDTSPYESLTRYFMWLEDQIIHAEQRERKAFEAAREMTSRHTLPSEPFMEPMYINYDDYKAKEVK